jgi:hypothetical protein
LIVRGSPRTNVAIVTQLVTHSPLVPPGGTGGSYLYSSGFIDAARNTVTVTIAAPEIPAQAAAAPLSSVTLTMTSSAPARRNRGHQRVRRVRARRAVLRRAGLLAGTAGRPIAPGTGGTAGLALSRRRGRREVMPPSRFRSSISASVVPSPAGSRVPSHRCRDLGFRADAASGAAATAGWQLSASHPSPNLPCPR